MGNQISTQTFQELNLQDLGQGLAQDKILGNGRLLKSVSCYTETGLLVVVKVYIKKQGDSQLDLTNFESVLKNYNEKLNLKEHPNVLAYHRIVQTEKSGYLVRQYFYSNLSDRLNTRPFFTELSKKWICFQILKGVEQMHSVNVFHGDIKSENILLTGYDWCFISDLSPYKKRYLPLDDPADFYYYFDISGKTTCLIAPERFIKKDSKEEYGIKDGSSDIFSLGCLFTQLFLDGSPLFDLSQLLQYRNGDSSNLKSKLEKIQIKEIKEMIQNMLDIEPNKRNTAKFYLESSVFPSYFEKLHFLLKDLIILDSDSKVNKICDSFDDILKIIDKNYEALDIIASFLCSSFRNAKDINQRVKGLNFIKRISQLCNDYTKYQRLIPYIFVMLSDPSPFVRSQAIRTLSLILNEIETFQLGENDLFSSYILPRFKGLSRDESEIVRVTFSEHLPLMAYHSRRLLELAQLKSSLDENTMNVKSNYDTDLNILHDEFSYLVLQMSMDSCTGVKRGLMKNIIKLALFYGKKKTCDILLPMLITFINSREWLLRYSFFEKISEISIFVGPLALKEYILPCLLSALYDVEEFVIHQTLNGLVSCIEICYIKKNDLIELSNIIAPMLHHPNVWIRYSSISFFSSVSKYLGFIENSCFILPILKNHLNYEILMINETSLLQTLKPSISRNSFDKLLKLGQLLETKQFALSNEENEIFLLMKNYIIHASKIMDSKLWDSKTVSEPIKTLIKLDDSVRKISKSIQPIIQKNKRQYHQLLTYSNEHKKGVNELCISEDNSFFISGGNDGTIKVWNLDKLEQDFLLKSKLTCTVNTMISNSIKSVSIYENKMCGSTDSGLIYLFDINKGQTDSIYHINNNILNHLDKEPISKFDNNISISSIKTMNNLLICGNQNGVVIGIDPRSKKEAFIWNNLNSYGGISTLYCENQWMLSGTSRGYLILSDLRYKIKVESLKVSNYQINKIGSYYSNQIPNVYILNDSNIIYNLNLENLKVTKQYKIESDKNNEFISDYYGIKELEKFESKENSTFSFQSCYVFQDGNFITGSSDKKIRYWNTSNFDHSYCFVGRSNNEVYKYYQNDQIFEEKIQKLENTTKKLGLSSSLPIGHLDTITDLQYDQNRSSIISCSKDGSIKIWS